MNGPLIVRFSSVAIPPVAKLIIPRKHCVLQAIGFLFSYVVAGCRNAHCHKNATREFSEQFRISWCAVGLFRNREE